MQSTGQCIAVDGGFSVHNWWHSSATPQLGTSLGRAPMCREVLYAWLVVISCSAESGAERCCVDGGFFVLGQRLVRAGLVVICCAGDPGRGFMHGPRCFHAGGRCRRFPGVDAGFLCA